MAPEFQPSYTRSFIDNNPQADPSTLPPDLVDRIEYLKRFSGAHKDLAMKILEIGRIKDRGVSSGKHIEVAQHVLEVHEELQHLILTSWDTFGLLESDPKTLYLEAKQAWALPPGSQTKSSFGNEMDQIFKGTHPGFTGKFLLESQSIDDIPAIHRPYVLMELCHFDYQLEQYAHSLLLAHE